MKTLYEAFYNTLIHLIPTTNPMICALFLSKDKEPEAYVTCPMSPRVTRPVIKPGLSSSELALFNASETRRGNGATVLWEREG